MATLLRSEVVFDIADIMTADSPYEGETGGLVAEESICLGSCYFHYSGWVYNDEVTSTAVVFAD